MYTINFVIQHSCNIYLYYELLLQIGIMKKKIIFVLLL